MKHHLSHSTCTKTEQEHAHPGACGCSCSHDHTHAPSSFPLSLFLGALFFFAGLLLSQFAQIRPLFFLSSALFLCSYFLLGTEVLIGAVRHLVRGKLLDEQFLMGISTIGAFLLGEWAEAVAVMLFYQVGEYFQMRAMQRSRRSIASLADLLPDTATRLLENGETQTVRTELVEVGNRILVVAGERIPLDGMVIEGNASLDVSALTGEFVPQLVEKGDMVRSGCINQNGRLVLKTTTTQSESTVSKILSLVESASERKAPSERFITRFSRFYTPLVVGVALLLALVVPLFLGALQTPALFLDWFYRALVFLVISCPCALVLSVPLAYFAGIGAASRKGILIKGGKHLDTLAQVKRIAFDKTGTLTHGTFSVIDCLPVASLQKEELFVYACLAQHFSHHPIAQSIKNACKLPIEEEKYASLSDFQEHAGKGVSVRFENELLLCGNRRLLEEHGISCSLPETTHTEVHLAYQNTYIGTILLADTLKESVPSAIEELRKLGIAECYLLSGDRAENVFPLAQSLGFQGAYDSLLPAQKVEHFTALSQNRSGKSAYVGDGINDAPVLACADVGIAMGDCRREIAMEHADVIFLNGEMERLTDSILLAKKVRRIVLENIFFSLLIKGLFLGLGAFGLIPIWAAVVADVGVSLLAVCNALRLLRN